MLGLQFLISGFFLIGVLVIYSQVHFMMTENAGFNKEQVLLVSLNGIENSYPKFQLAQKVFANSQHVEDVSGSLFVPGHGFSSGTNFQYKENSFNVASNVVDFNYLDFAEIKLIKGRKLSHDFASDTNRSILINETAAKLAGIYDDPIGKEIDLGWDVGKGMKVVGMFRPRSLSDVYGDLGEFRLGPKLDWHRAIQSKTGTYARSDCRNRIFLGR